MTFKYMLDTDSVSFALRGQGNVGSRILEHRPSELCISSITVAELRFGAHKRDSKKLHKLIDSKKLHKLIDTFAQSIAPQDFGIDAADEYGRLAAELTRHGTPIGTFDAMIAAHALAKKLTLVTSNEKHFRTVPGLRVENWV